MNKYFIFLILLFFSCNEQTITEKDAWNALLIDFEIEKPYEYFSILIKKEPEIKKNYLGLTYTECILERGNWHETLNKFSQNEEDLWKYGHFATIFKSYIKNKDIKTGLNINEFRALHLDGKFKLKKNSQIIEGEYKNLKPYGVWKFSKLNGDFIREENFNKK